MEGIVCDLADGDGLVGTTCPVCNEALRIGERVVIKPTAPALHKDCGYPGN